MKHSSLKEKVKKYGLVTVGASALSTSAFADTVSINTTDAIAQLGEAQTAIAAVGGAIIILAAISLTYRWVKATFF